MGGKKKLLRAFTAWSCFRRKKKGPFHFGTNFITNWNALLYLMYSLIAKTFRLICIPWKAFRSYLVPSYSAVKIPVPGNFQFWQRYFKCHIWSVFIFLSSFFFLFNIAISTNAIHKGGEHLPRLDQSLQTEATPKLSISIALSAQLWFFRRNCKKELRHPLNFSSKTGTTVCSPKDDTIITATILMQSVISNTFSTTWT